MVVQFSSDGQGTSPKGPGAAGPGRQDPDQVRKKWDALLNVINNVSADSPSQGADASQRPPLRAARELVNDTSAAARASPGTGRRPDWNYRHHLMYKDAGMQKNIRSYFDRTREIDSNGLRYDAPLRTIWQLETPEVRDPPGTLRGHYAKFNSPQGSPSSRPGLLPAIADQEAMSPQSTGMSRSKSEPTFHGMRETGWNGRHHVVFGKDNHHYHSNLREYFERPRAVLW